MRVALACTPCRFAAGEQQVVALVERACTAALPAAAAEVEWAYTAALPAAAARVEWACTAALVGQACTAAWPAAVACTRPALFVQALSAARRQAFARTWAPQRLLLVALDSVVAEKTAAYATA